MQSHRDQASPRFGQTINGNNTRNLEDEQANQREIRRVMRQEVDDMDQETWDADDDDDDGIRAPD